MSKHVLRVAAIGATAAVAGGIAFGFHEQGTADSAGKDAAAWQAEVHRWQAVARQAVKHDRAVAKQNRLLVARYNALATDAQTANAKLLAALRTANSVRTVTAAQQTVYRTVSAAPAAAASAPSSSAPSAPSSSTS